jgi:DNA-binding response OmpR family regulator
MKKILVAEDDKKIGAALEIRLQAAGYEVQIVSDGLRSYFRAMTWKPDLLLMDIYMPVGNGLDVAGELASAGLAGIPIIFMTASKKQNLRERSQGLNAIGFFEKPFDTKKLLALIFRTLRSKPVAPLQPAAPAKRSAARSLKAAEPDPKKILVVDDDAKIAQGLKVRLESAGYQVTTAADGVYGLRLAIELKPALVILDIWMPVGGGFSVAHRLREKFPDVPVVFITASRQQGLKRMAKNLGAVGFIEKPYQPEDLLAVVAQATKGKLPSRLPRKRPARLPSQSEVMAGRPPAPGPLTSVVRSTKI